MQGNTQVFIFGPGNDSDPVGVLSDDVAVTSDLYIISDKCWTLSTVYSISMRPANQARRPEVYCTVISFSNTCMTVTYVHNPSENTLCSNPQKCLASWKMRSCFRMWSEVYD